MLRLMERVRLLDKEGAEQLLQKGMELTEDRVGKKGSEFAMVQYQLPIVILLAIGIASGRYFRGLLHDVES